MSPLGLSLLALLATSLVCSVLRTQRFRLLGWFAALPPALITVWLITQLPSVAADHFPGATYSWAPSLGLELALRLDGLSLLFGLVIAGIGAAVALYTAEYLPDDPRQGYFYSLLFLFMASMLGLVWADNLLALFVFWEGTSISSYLLIGFRDNDAQARAGARRALLVTAGGGLAMLLGMVMLGQTAGTYTISTLIATPGLTDTPYFPVALMLLLVGAFTKSAQAPFHFWLPGAMAAPTPASAYLHSATMVKAGIFLLARLHPALGDHSLWFWALLLTGAATMLIAAVTALGQTDIKALLAYATVSQLGVLVMLLALPGEVAAMAAAVGMLAHALYKGPLFLLAGIIDHATGTRDLRRLGTLGRELPWVALIALLAGLSMAGIPPLFGFVAKELLLETFVEAVEQRAAFLNWAILAVVEIGGAIFVAYSLTLLWEAFWRGRAVTQPAAPVHHAPSLTFVLPPLVLTLLGVAAPYWLAPLGDLLLAPSVEAIIGEPVDYHLALWHGWTPVLAASLTAIALGSLVFLARGWIRRGLNALPAELSGAPLFDRLIHAVYVAAIAITRLVQGGTLAQQVSVVLGLAVVALVVALLSADAPFTLAGGLITPPDGVETVLAALAVFAALTTVRARTRLNAIVSLGVVGIAITVYFILFGAPDLAMTQLLVDILTVVLLILVFYRIPFQPPSLDNRRAPVRDLVIAGAVGLLGFALALIGTAPAYFPTMAGYFATNAVTLGHGGNIVNVILVDFRGFDTLGEITVLSLAALGGYAIMRATLFRRTGPPLDALERDPTTSE